jgi:hypothetical protein
MNIPSSVKRAYDYSLRAYLPLFFLWVPVLLIFGLGGAIMLMIGEFKMALYEMSIVLFPIPLLFVAYYADRATNSIVVKGLIIYCFWAVVMVVLSFCFLSALGGVSMASVDNPGLVSFATIYPLAVQNALYAQPIILLFTVIGIHRIRKGTAPLPPAPVVG